jgi:4-hydroxybenzoyl-CoA thioesterase
MPFVSRHPVRFGDCDISGTVYFPSYLNILVSAVEEFFDSLGWPWPMLATEFGFGFPTVRLNVEFTAPGRHGDVLECTMYVRRVGSASLDLEHEIRTAGRLLWTASQRLVATSFETLSSMPLPAEIRADLIRVTEEREGAGLWSPRLRSE